MAITGHKSFAVFQRYNNPTEEDVKDSSDARFLLRWYIKGLAAV
jgi:hypothetical protein